MGFLTNFIKLYPLFLIAFCISLALGDTHETLAKKSVSGKPYYVKTSAAPHQDIPELYDTIHSVLFEFTTPNWTKPINLIGYTCTGDNYDTDGYSCPVLWYWLTGIRDKLQEQIFVDNMKIPDLSKFSTEPNCGELRQAFDGFFLDAQSRSDFLSFISSTPCTTEATTVLLRSDKYLANAIDAPYRTMREKFFQEYYSLQTPLNRSNDAMYTNARYNFYSSGLFDYYIESRRWTDALSECKSGRIPPTLISPSEFATILRGVASNASLNEMELVLGEDQLSRYYKLEGIADCAFTPDSIMIVLQVPLRLVDGESSRQLEQSSSPNHKHILEFLPVPYFNEKGQVCSLELEKDARYIAIPSSDSNDDDEETSTTTTLVPVKELHCHQKSGFCHVHSEDVEMGLESKSCQQVLFEEEDDSEACKIRCGKRSSFKLPMTTKVGDDRILIFGGKAKGKQEVKIVCPDFQKMEPINSSKGSVEVTVPCGCEIHKGGKTIFKAKGNCGGEVHVIQV